MNPLNAAAHISIVATISGDEDLHISMASLCVAAGISFDELANTLEAMVPQLRAKGMLTDEDLASMQRNAKIFAENALARLQAAHMRMN